jgi:hypothetical protein
MTRFENTNRFLWCPKTVPLALLTLLFCFVVSGSEAQPHTGVAAAIIPVKVKTRVQALGLGARVKVSTVFQAKPYQGYITSIGENSFEVTDVTNWRDNTFSYSIVTRIAGHRLPDSDKPIANRELRAAFNIVSKLGIGP